MSRARKVAPVPADSLLQGPRSADAPLLLEVPRYEQPDDVTCGPACLVQVYRFHGYPKPFADVIRETPRNPDGGTLVPNLGISALRNGFRATVIPFGVRIFDPTWRGLGRAALRRKLHARGRAVKSVKVRRTVDAYLTFLQLGGRVRYAEMGRDLLVELLSRGTPIITGLSATYLYRQARELDEQPDDVRGFPVGHFVVVSGYYPRTNRFIVRDPSKDIPFSRTGRYSVPTERLITAILLGDVTFDAVLLVLERPPGARALGAPRGSVAAFEPRARPA